MTEQQLFVIASVVVIVTVLFVRWIVTEEHRAVKLLLDWFPTILSMVSGTSWGMLTIYLFNLL
ncbi:hypothetical protein [Ekhidna sp.]|uniref:hypothetical protein n=1 Tax=Ekhidna sp. TaxID=2608089 RepID=UPI0032968AA5